MDNKIDEALDYNGVFAAISVDDADTDTELDLYTAIQRFAKNSRVALKVEQARLEAEDARLKAEKEAADVAEAAVEAERLKALAEEAGEDFTEKEIKPIVGCEFFMCENHKDKTHKDNGFQTVVLAKNRNGYHNLAKLASYANIDGFYYVPRIDRELLLEYKENLIVLSGGIWGEIPNKILFEGNKKAEEACIWWKENFGDWSCSRNWKWSYTIVVP